MQGAERSGLRWRVLSRSFPKTSYLHTQVSLSEKRRAVSASCNILGRLQSFSGHFHCQARKASMFAVTLVHLWLAHVLAILKYVSPSATHAQTWPHGMMALTCQQPGITQCLDRLLHLLHNTSAVASHTSDSDFHSKRIRCP